MKTKITLPKLEQHMQEIVQGASIAFVVKVVSAGLAFGFNLVLARFLGAEGAGVYFLAFSIATVASVVGRLGLDNPMVRFVAGYAAVPDWGALKGVYKKGMMLALAASGASFTIVFLSAPLLSIYIFSKPELEWPIRCMSLGVVPTVLFFLHSETLKGLKRIRDAVLIQGAMVPGFALVGLLIFGRLFGVIGAIWVHNSAAALTAMIGYLIWRKNTSHMGDIEGSFDIRRLIQSGVPLLWVASINLIMNWTATFCLGIWAAEADVGVFGVAFRTALTMSFILTAVNSIAGPKFAELHKLGDIENLKMASRNSAKLMTLMVSPLFLAFVVFSEEVMGLFGPGFVVGKGVLVILVLGQLVNVATGSVGKLLLMTGYERTMRNVVFVAAGINVGLNLALVPRYGMIGAAISTSVSLAAQNLLATFLCYRKLNFVVVPIPEAFALSVRKLNALFRL